MALKKSLGQHLLIDKSILKEIVDLIDAFPDKSCLIEVGPGKGALTEYIGKLDFKSFYVIEKDNQFAVDIEKQYPNLTGHIIHKDVLEVNLTQFQNRHLSVVGNYPYNISNQIVFWILDYRDYVSQSVGMFQKEVAARIASSHGTKTYGILSVLTQAFYHVVYELDVPPESFDPPPKVMSGVISMMRRDSPKAEYKPLKHIVKLAFNQRRKMLRNSLKGIQWEDSSLFDSLSELRPEQISVDQFCELSKQLIK